jgi:hypothetical protein
MKEENLEHPFIFKQVPQNLTKILIPFLAFFPLKKGNLQ